MLTFDGSILVYININPRRDDVGGVFSSIVIIDVVVMSNFSNSDCDGIFVSRL